MFKNIIENKFLILIPAAFLLYELTIVPEFYHKIANLICISVITVAVLTCQKRNKLTKILTNQNNQLTQVIKRIFEHCPDSIFIKDANSRYIAGNKAMLKMWGYKSEKDFINKTDYEYFTEDVAEKIQKVDKEIIKHKIVIEEDSEHILNKTKTIVRKTKAPLINERGEPFGIIGIVRDITIEKKYQEYLEEKQNFLISILDHLPFLAYLRKFDGTLLYKNEYCDTFVNSPSSQFTIETYYKFFEQYKQEIIENDKELLKTGEPLSFQKTFCINKINYFFDFYKIPMYKDGKINAILTIAQDITIEKETEKQKETFVATLTHDLKTPTIAQLKALDYFLAKNQSNMSEEDKELLNEVYNSCKYMHKMINNLITTYKYEDGKIKLNPKDFNLVELIQGCLTELKYLYKEKNQEIRIIAENQQTTVCADSLELKRVIMNLIANSINHTPTNSQIIISITDNTKSTIFEIKNEAKDVTEQELQTFFNKFVSGTNKYKQTGTGLGLYLSKQIISLHKGNIYAKKAEDDCIFGFELFKNNTTEPLQEQKENTI